MRQVLAVLLKTVATLLLIPALLVSTFLAWRQDTRAADTAWQSIVRSTDARLAQQLATYAMEHAGSYPSTFQEISEQELNKLRLPSSRSQFVTRAILARRLLSAAIAAVLIAILLN